MNEYMSRNELTRVDRVSPRSPSPVSAVQSIAANQRPAMQHGNGQGGQHPPGDAATSVSEDDLASAAEYAKMHARVADILADLKAYGGEVSVEAADAAIQTMLPTPIILVPLPPASKEAVESAVMLGKRIAEQASYAHAAQAHLKRGAVDQILSSGY